MKRATPRRNGPNNSKLARCVDQCTTYNLLHFLADGIHIGPTVSPAMSVLCLAQSVQSFQTTLNPRASAGMPHRRERAQYQQVSAFKRGRMVGLWEAGLSYRDIAAFTGHAATTVMHVWNQRREEGHTQRRAGTGPRNVATARDDGHLVCMAMMDHRASSTVLNQRWSTETGLHCLLQHFFAVF